MVDIEHLRAVPEMVDPPDAIGLGVRRGDLALISRQPEPRMTVGQDERCATAQSPKVTDLIIKGRV